MQEYPTRWASHEDEAEDDVTHEKAIRFMLQVIDATIYSSCDDYDRAVRDFFAQLEALGHLIQAADLDDVTLFLRRRCRRL